MKYFIGYIFLSCMVFQSCTQSNEKINGVSFVASNNAIADEHLSPVVSLNSNYAALMPFGFIKTLEHPDILFNTEKQWFGEREAGVIQYAEKLKAKHIKLMIKPQLWVWRGEYTGDIIMKTETDWLLLETAYRHFILEYARVAEAVNADIYCIGTELDSFIAARPDFWHQLIREVKRVYSGQLTYAANWDEYKRTPFWGALDYIGIDAYFPVSDSRTPTVEECVKGWLPYKEEIKRLSERLEKPVLFTEFGYRSVDFSGKEPWVSDRRKTTLNFEAQTATTKALFDTFWKEDWFAGGFIWKWFHNHNESGGMADTRFTPQNKPVERVIQSHYKKFK
ncbi:glycoside hydrolase [Bizionia gelidisalsuginis]|uniref:Glycoside hydrolase n=1 Tax=Bizionia gelidisalsuginis TaxID=291188 RepID=A0ABY3M9Z1_9FLAO|nr:glycoside hydrolase TIM-barrel-like domain-containing protein [Bizionia gelidisalsuginis]TYC12103.1 glycoside hydrolase [Bizionia gelidisalsuginis]